MVKSSLIERQKNSFFYIICGVAILVSSFPLACSYIMDGGIIIEWIARIEEVAEGMKVGHFYLYPSEEVFLSANVWENVLASNLWFLFPAWIYHLTGNIVMTYRLFMFLLQLATGISACMFFLRIFGKNDLGATALGVLLYLCCPYRIYLCYDASNLCRVVVWALLPLYSWAIVGILREKKCIREEIVIALCLAGIGYEDAVLGVFFIIVALVVNVIRQRIVGVVLISLSAIIMFPAWNRLYQYWIESCVNGIEIPFSTIEKSGYHIGEYFLSYSFRNGYPGLGLAMITGLVFLVWQWMIMEYRIDKKDVILITLAVISMILSLKIFPWSEKFAFTNIQSAFAGLTCFLLCIPVADVVIKSYSKKKTIVPVLIAMFSIGICVYQCNMLTYYRLPIVFPE